MACKSRVPSHRPARGDARTGGRPSPAEIENAIRDLKHGVGEPSPLGPLRRAWLAVQVMAHNSEEDLGEQVVTTKAWARRAASHCSLSDEN